MPSPNTLDLNHLPEDLADLFALYKNLRRTLVELTAAGPLMEIRHTTSRKLENNERVSHAEGTRVSEQIRMLFKLRAILIDAGLPLELPVEQPAEEPARSQPEDRTAALLTRTRPPFNPGLKTTREPEYERPFIPLDLLRKPSASSAAG